MSNIVPLEKYRRRRQAQPARKDSGFAVRLWNKVLAWTITSPFVGEIWWPFALMVGCAFISGALVDKGDPFKVFIAGALAVAFLVHTIAIIIRHVRWYFTDEPVRDNGPRDENPPPPRAA